VDDRSDAQRNINAILDQIDLPLGRIDAHASVGVLSLKRTEQRPPGLERWREGEPQHAAAMIGREAVRAAYKNVFDTIKLEIAFSIHEVEVLGDVAWARTSSAARMRVRPADVEVKEGNNELFVFRKEGGEWKIHRYLFATTQPRA
jgi:SnoaL-like domain